MMIDNNDSNRIGCFSVTCFFTFSLLLFFENSASSLAFLSPHDSLSLSLSLLERKRNLFINDPYGQIEQIFFL